MYGTVTRWQRTERWLALFSFVAAVAGLLGWIGAVATGSGGLSVLLLVLTVAVGLFAVSWVVKPGALRWWSGLVVLIVAVGPAVFAFVALHGAIPHVAGLFTLVAIALSSVTVVRRYEMPPIGR
jgi:hypothetical protein